MKKDQEEHVDQEEKKAEEQENQQTRMADVMEGQVLEEARWRDCRNMRRLLIKLR